MTLKVKRDVVQVPEIPPENRIEHILRVDTTSATPASQENRRKALETMLEYYPGEGQRRDFMAALSGFLYRAGLSAPAVASFNYDLALDADDEEAVKREQNAWAICEAIDDHKKAPGLKTLTEEFEFAHADEIKNFLDLDGKDIEGKIQSLNNNSAISQVEEVIKLIACVKKSDQMLYVQMISDQSGHRIGFIKALLEKVKADLMPTPPDPELWLARKVLEDMYAGGKELLLYHDSSFWAYKNQHWGRTNEDIIRAKSTQVLERVREEVPAIADMRMNSLLKGAMEHLAPAVAKEGDVLRLIDEPYPVINCKNCEVWIDEKGDVTIKPHRPESYQTYRLEVDYIPVAYRNDMEPGDEAPLLKQTLLDIFRDCGSEEDVKDVVRHFMEFFGYALQSSRNIPCFWLLKGPGRNGKTILIKLLIKMLNPRSVISDRIDSIEREHFKIGAMAGKKLLVDDDVGVNAKLDDGFIKRTSETKLASGQLKGKDQFEFEIRIVMVLLSNHWPPVPDYSFGFQRRAFVIPFNRTFEEHEVDPDRLDKIWEQERSGVLNWAIESYRNLRKRGKFLEPKVCADAKREWFTAGATNMKKFMDENCEHRAEASNQWFSEFCERYEMWCMMRGVKVIESRDRIRMLLEVFKVEFGVTNSKTTIKGLFARYPNDPRPM